MLFNLLTITFLFLTACRSTNQSATLTETSNNPIDKHILGPKLEIKKTPSGWRYIRYHDGFQYNTIEVSPELAASVDHKDCPNLSGKYEIVENSIEAHQNIRIYNKYVIRQLGCFVVAIFPDQRGNAIKGGIEGVTRTYDLTLFFGVDGRSTLDDRTHIIAPTSNGEYEILNQHQDFTIDVLSFVYPYWIKAENGETTGLRKAFRVYLRKVPEGLGKIEQDTVWKIAWSSTNPQEIDVNFHERTEERRRGDIVELEGATRTARFRLRKTL